MSDQKRSWAEYYDRQYISGDALPPEGRTFTIADKSRDEVEGKEGKEHKLALSFTDGNRFLVNVTNAHCMEKLFASKFPADWVGHQVTLIFDPTVKFGKETVGGIRVKGSPELTKPLTFQFQENSRKKPRTITLVPTNPQAKVEPTHDPEPVQNPRPVDDGYEDEEFAFMRGPDDGQV